MPVLFREELNLIVAEAKLIYLSLLVSLFSVSHLPSLLSNKQTNKAYLTPLSF